MKDTYKTIAKKAPEVLFKDKGSKFFGYAFPVSTEDDIKLYLEEIKTSHNSARHHCYAWQLGTGDGQVQYRANDDGEPSNTAGMPIYGQIQSFNVTNVLIVVVRYFGGVKLGVGGLINAYKTTAQMCLEASSIIEKTIDNRYLIAFQYKDMNNVMRVIKEKNLQIESQKMDLSCKITVSIRKSEAKQAIKAFESFYEVNITEV
ncbi:IMPACT family protein [Galbibacter pacificus]|uniref:YigZ family protein n=1 Tax=Galbibacter pacificus TaxID=2996052 RepID=A0ABT6FPW5_9FLAO|nr:YigZ family protein [Galbibacter pacificus]MDG3582368.1 YigZ family protein [Galbibacter pacificus]MDG3585156.1 YigZ family protein [Galbibacter pacificus]